MCIRDRMNPGVDLVHPEFLYKHFKNSLKVLHFIDDPHATYNYCLPYSWAFDAATYISPSYSKDLDMSQLLKLTGFKYTHWTPLNGSNIHSPKWTNTELEKQLKTRKKEAVYFGNYYTDKMERLITLKKNFKKKLSDIWQISSKRIFFFYFLFIKKKSSFLYTKLLFITNCKK